MNKEKNRFISTPFYFPYWYIIVFIAAIPFLYFYSTSLCFICATYPNELRFIGDIFGYATVKTWVTFLAILICLWAVVLSTILMFISLTIYLFSQDSVRAAKAGGLLKSSIGFIFGSATALIATINLTQMVG